MKLWAGNVIKRKNTEKRKEAEILVLKDISKNPSLASVEKYFVTYIVELQIIFKKLAI